jgi:AMP deaminase
MEGIRTTLGSSVGGYSQEINLDDTGSSGEEHSLKSEKTERVAIAGKSNRRQRYAQPEIIKKNRPKEKSSERALSEFFAEDIPNYSNPAEELEYQRVVLKGKYQYPEEMKDACQNVLHCLRLRKKYKSFNIDMKKNWGGLEPGEYIHQEKTSTPLVCNVGLGAANTKKKDQTKKNKNLNSTRRRPDVLYEPFKLRPVPSASECDIVCNRGVFGVLQPNDLNLPSPLSGLPNCKDTSPSGTRSAKVEVLSYAEFENDIKYLFSQANHGPMKSLCYSRCSFLKAKFDTHVMLNRDRELMAQKQVPHRDFYNVRKVDTHIHHSACMNAKHLLRFIKKKLRTCSDEVVINRDGKFLTLGDVFRSLGFTAYDLSVDTLDTHAHHETFHRFDRFNLKYNPCGQSRLREIFIKNNNLIQGRYLGDITREVFTDLSSSKYQLMEPRISIYGRNPMEWHDLGKWICSNRLLVKEIRWMVQLPRLYRMFKKLGMIYSFQDILNNFFKPLFKVSQCPSSDPDLYLFLQHMTGFDCVDDESQPETRDSQLPPPAQWTRKDNPPYHYWLYYLWANIKTLNKFRHSLGMSTFSLRPHCGEAGNKFHLSSGFLLAEHINHGIRLKQTPVLLYLYYLEQIGLAMSPLSNNRLFLTYAKNPFIDFFKMGLNVSLSTDDPLQLHFTKDALLEEYSVARQVYDLSNADVCELARNSVLQSGFEHPFKDFFLGEMYYKMSTANNDITMTNVPDIRLVYRNETLQEEFKVLYKGASSILKIK